MTVGDVEPLDLFTFSLEARAVGHRLPILDAPDVSTFTVELEPPEWASEGLGLEWWKFHREHPEIERALVGLARPLLTRGYTHLGISMLWETLRYRTMLGAKVPEDGEWRLPNNHRAYYARWLMHQHADLAGVFATAALRSEED